VAVIALMTAGTSVVAILGGVVAFGEPLGASPAIVALRVAAIVALIAGGWWLAPAQAAMMDAAPPRPGQPPATSRRRNTRYEAPRHGSA
jgi:hypothetical protein